MHHFCDNGFLLKTLRAFVHLCLFIFFDGVQTESCDQFFFLLTELEVDSDFVIEEGCLLPFVEAHVEFLRGVEDVVDTVNVLLGVAIFGAVHQVLVHGGLTQRAGSLISSEGILKRPERS